MASLNGALSPTPLFDDNNTPLNASAKRKREGSDDPEHTSANGDSNHQHLPQRPLRDPQQQISDFIEILKSHDTKPSVLNRELPTRDRSAEPEAKRKKSDSTDASTIVARAKSGTYLSLDDVVSDVKAAATAVYEELRLPNSAARTQYTPIPPQASEVASKVIVFRKKAEEILQREKMLETLGQGVKVGGHSQAVTNGSTASKSFTQLTTEPGDNKLVLTLFGNAPGAKQLFSSLQKPIEVSEWNTDVTQPLREAGLPNGISTTQIIPIQSTGMIEEKKRTPTIGELFSTPTSTLPFQPPKPSRIATTRSTQVGWYQPTGLEHSRLHSSQSYYGQNIRCGQWLEYTGFAAPDAKRKHRDRALSLSGIRPSISAVDTAEQEAAKLDALFRSAYSGFAPSKDDATALVPEGLVNRIWWRRHGEKSFKRLVHNAVTAEETSIDGDTNLGNTIDDKELEELEEAVQEWDVEAIDPSLEDLTEPSKSIEDKDVEEVLHDISELLETLDSYQRIRNLSLNPPSRSTVAPSVPETAGPPAKPNEAEIATYNTLKAQLSLMIAMLPPYAVSKLNSDQLAELNISTKVEIPAESHKGVMEEDEAAARARVNEMKANQTSRIGAQPVSSHRSSSSLYGNQYSSSPRPSGPSGQQFYAPSQTPIRPPSTGLQRPPSTAPAPFGGVRPASSTSYQSQTSYGTPTYPHQLPRSQPQYSQTNSQQYFRTPNTQSYGQAQGQNYGTAPQTAPQVNPRYQATNQGAYQHNQTRPQGLSNGMDYRFNANGATAARQASPQKPQTYSPQPQAQALNRPFGTPTPSLSQTRQYFPAQALTNGGGSISPQPQVVQQSSGVQGHLGATGYHTVMTAEQQASMMERQRAQLAQQQGTQQQARNAAQAGAMSASPLPQVNGGAVSAGN